jgi:hypothetical protein
MPTIAEKAEAAWALGKTLKNKTNQQSTVFRPRRLVAE